MPPDASDVILERSNLWRTAYPIYEHSTVLARSYFDERGYQFEPHFFAHQVRFHARRMFQEAGQSAEYDLEDLTNSGICFSHRGFRIKARKCGRHGSIPMPGGSRAQQVFYCQGFEQRCLPLDFRVETSMQPNQLNLLLLWHPTAAHTLDRLSLACTKLGSRDRRIVEAYWHDAIPHPATTLLGQPPTDLRVGAAEDTNDLPNIRRRPLPNTGTEHGE